MVMAIVIIERMETYRSVDVQTRKCAEMKMHMNTKLAVNWSTGFLDYIGP